LVRTLLAHGTGIADVTRLDQPDACKRDLLFGGKPSNDPVQRGIERSLVGDRVGDALNSVGVHG
jgi:hypothetical protein